MKCPKCGKELPDGSAFCTECGQSLKTKSEPVESTAKPEAKPEPAAQGAAKPEGEKKPFFGDKQGKKEEKKKHLDEKSLEELSRPVGMLRYFVMFLALGVPILNIVMLFRWGFGWGVNKNVRNFARGALLYGFLMLILTIFIWVVWPEFFSGILGFFEKLAAFKLVANS